MHVIFSIPKMLHISAKNAYKADSKCDCHANIII